MSKKAKNSIRFLLIKLLGAVILVGVLLAILTTVGLHYFLSSGQIKQTLINKAENMTGRDMSINKIRWSVFPTPHLELHGIKLANPKGFQHANMATVKHAAMGIKIWPLFHHRLVISKAEADGAKVYFIKNKQGKTNWNWKSSAALSQSQHNKSSHDQQNDSNNSLLKGLTVSIPNLRIRDTHITYTNKNHKQTIQLNDIQFEALHIKLQKSFPIELKMGLSMNDNVKWIVNYNGQMEISKRLKFVQFSQGRLLLKPQRDDILGLVFKSLRAQIRWDAPWLELPDFSTQVAQGQIKANAKINFDKSQPSQISLQAKHIDLHKFLKTLMNYGDIKGKAYLKTNLRSNGLQSKALISHLNGQGHLKLNNAQWRDVNLGALYNRGLGLLQKSGHAQALEEHPASEKPGRLSANYKVKQGVITTKDLTFVTPLIRIKGQGHINLVNKHIHMGVNIVGIKDQTSYGPTIPVKLRGKINDLQIQPDVQAIATNYLQQGSNAVQGHLQNLQDAGQDITQTLSQMVPN